jgi:hypothetical protein
LVQRGSTRRQRSPPRRLQGDTPFVSPPLSHPLCLTPFVSPPLSQPLSHPLCLTPFVSPPLSQPLSHSPPPRRLRGDAAQRAPLSHLVSGHMQRRPAHPVPHVQPGPPATHGGPCRSRPGSGPTRAMLHAGAGRALARVPPSHAIAHMRQQRQTAPQKQRADRSSPVYLSARKDAELSARRDAV